MNPKLIGITAAVILLIGIIGLIFIEETTEKTNDTKTKELPEPIFANGCLHFCPEGDNTYDMCACENGQFAYRGEIT